MTSAKITRCNHMFHEICLRKWLYIQERCPFCHEIIMNQEATNKPAGSQSENEPNENQNNNFDALDDEDDGGVEVLEDNLDL